MYEHGFEKLKHILGDDYYDPKTKEKMRKEREQKKKLEEQAKVKIDSEEPMIEEITDDQAAEIEQKKKEEDSQAKKPNKIGDTVLPEPTTIDLSKIEEGKCEVKPENEGTRMLLKGFRQSNVKFHLLTDSIDKLYTKSKYKDLFDIGVLSIHSANKIDPELMTLFKDGAKIHIESADNVVIMKKEQRAEFRAKIAEKCEKANMKLVGTTPYNHHMFYEVKKEDNVKV